MQLAESYMPNPRADYLLIVNNRTIKKEVAAWRKFVELFNSEVSVFNISLYKGFSVNFKRSDGKCLLDDFAGKGTFLFLNNECRDHFSEDLKSPYFDLADIYLMQLIRQFKIRVLILGEKGLSSHYPLLPLCSYFSYFHSLYLSLSCSFSPFSPFLTLLVSFSSSTDAPLYSIPSIFPFPQNFLTISLPPSSLPLLPSWYRDKSSAYLYSPFPFPFFFPSASSILPHPSRDPSFVPPFFLYFLPPPPSPFPSLYT